MKHFSLCSSGGQAAARREPRRIGAIALKSSEKPHFFQIIRHPQKGWVRGPRLVPNLSSLARLRAGKLCCDPASEPGNEFEDRRTRDFEAKAAEIIGLYLAPPAHAAVFCVDEKSAIQALDRLDPVLPLSPGRAERHGFEHFRHGTLSLYAALETSSGQLIGSTASRHPSQEFVRFLQEVVATQPSGKEIHLIVDNLSAYKTKLVERFLADHPKLSLHYTPTYRSWLHQVENWFSKVQRHVMPVESSHPWPTCVANSCATSKPTIRLPLPFDGPTRTQPIESQRSCFI